MTGMDADSLARLAFLVLLALALGGWFLMQARQSPSRTLQALAVWGLIFLGLVAGYGLWHDIRDDIAPRQAVMGDGRVSVPRGPDGHYHLTLRVNGAPVDFVVDTGATDIVLSRADAARAGIDVGALRFTGQARTANGTVPTARVRLATVELGGHVDRDLRAVVNGGDLDGSLLGMGYLHLFTRIEIAGGELVLTR
jgi:aspartyl protease family protein